MKKMAQRFHAIRTVCMATYLVCVKEGVRQMNVIPGLAPHVGRVSMHCLFFSLLIKCLIT